MAELAVTDFKGLRNDRGPKYIGDDRFYDLVNFNYDSFVGADKALNPDRINSVEYEPGASIDGMFEFNFLNTAGQSVIEQIFVTNGKIYKNFKSPVLIRDGLQPGKVTFTTFENKLYIANGLNYVQIYDGANVTQMGAPFLLLNGIGPLNGNYIYAVTYTTAFGEEVNGSQTHVITTSNNQIKLDVPIGYTGVTSRKIYRTKSGETQLKLLTTIADNVTTEYIDITPDSALGANIPAVNNEMPKPFFIETSKDKLVGCVDLVHPTYIYNTNGLSDVFDPAKFSSTASISNDNTPIVGMKPDYAVLILGTQKNIYVLDVEDPEAVSLTLTRSNVGVKNGYSMVNVPTGEDFAGGVMFATTLDDVRLFSGNFAQPVATSLDNLKTANFGQPIKQLLARIIRSGSQFSGVFYDYKYHLGIDNQMIIFDVRNQSWWLYDYGAYSFGLIGSNLYRGLMQSSYIERMYSNINYLGVPTTAFIRSGDLLASEAVRYFYELHIFYANTDGAKVNVQITVEDNYYDAINENFIINAGAYDYDFYNDKFYQTDTGADNYRVFYVNRWGRWINFKVTNTEGRLQFRGYRIITDDVLNKESA